MKTMTAKPKTKGEKAVLGLLLALFLAYLFVMSLLLLFRGGRLPQRSANLLPFSEITLFFRAGARIGWQSSVFLINIVGNIMCFVPLGMFLSLLWPGHSLLCVLFTGLTSIAVEAAQYLFYMGNAATDDVLLNTVGGALGVLAVLLLRKLCKTEARARLVGLILLGGMALFASPMLLQTIANRVSLLTS